MYSVFLVEDEIVIRDGLKTSFPWEQHGFAYVGDAADGEMALPLIRQTKPDVLITDIRMPFMDGIALSKMVKKELPSTRIIIISGFDDFTYAQEAISIGVDNYLLKPITKDKLAQVMAEAKAKLDAEQERDNYLEQFTEESQEYEQFSRVRFFNQLVSGALSVTEVYEKSAELGLNLDAKKYNIVLLDFTPMNGNNQAAYSKHMASMSEQLMQYLKCCPEYAVFHWNMDTYAIIIKGDEMTIGSHTANCIENITRRCSSYDEEINWYLAEGGVIERFSEFPACCQRANKKLSCRYINPGQHIFTDEDVALMNKQNQEAETTAINQRLVGLFLENAFEEEIDDFLENLIPGSTTRAMKSVLFCQYFAMTMYVCVSDYLKKIGADPAAVFPADIRKRLESTDGDEILALVKTMFAAAIAKRQGDDNKHYKDQLQQAMQYIDEHYYEPTLTLNEVAKEVDISPSYLSAMFSKETESTFVEYMTAKRMEMAKKLLRETKEKTAVVSEKVGYKDPHYFSFIFKKTYGMSPKEYRQEGVD